MKRLIYILLITLVLTGCGKVNKPVKEETVNDVKEEVVQDVEVEEEDNDQETSEDTTQTEATSNIDSSNTQSSEPVSEKRTMYAKSSVNVRSGAGTSNAKIGSLSKGQEVVKVGEENGWSKIEFNGTVGYVNSNYLSTEKVETNTTSAGNTVTKPNNGSTNTEIKPEPQTSQPAHEHSWEEITEKKKVYYAWRTLCGRCGTDMTDMSDDDLVYHVTIICSSRYSTKYIAVDFETQDYKIFVTNVGYKCSCGATKEGTGASWVEDSHVTIY